MVVRFCGHREGLDHGSVRRKVAVENGYPTVRAERVGPRADDFFPGDLNVVQVTAPLGKKEWAVLDLVEVLSQRLAGDGETPQVQHLAQFEHQSGNASRVPEVLHRVPAGRLDIRKYRNQPVNAVEVVDGDVDARLVRDHRKMEQRVRRPTGGGMQDDRVLERIPGQDAPGVRSWWIMLTSCLPVARA